MIKKISLAFIFLMFLFSKGESQSYNTGIPVKMDGYLINLNGEILFQPCEDSSINFWESLDNRSFSIWCNQFIDQYCDAIRNIGDSVILQRCFVSSDSTNCDNSLSFFYCSFEMDMDFLSTSENDFKVYKNPLYQIFYNQSKYQLKGFYIRGWVKKLIPKDVKKLRLMYNYYLNKGYTVPEWLYEATQSKTN